MAISRWLCDTVVLSAVGLACYSELLALHRSWVYDDEMNFMDEPMPARLSKLSTDNVIWACIEGTVIGVYEPIALIAKMASAQVLGGLSADNIVLANLILHILNSIIAW
jgi:hypothetical protein